MPDNRFTALFKEADEAFDGAYGTELNELNGLSKTEIDQITPDTSDLRDYNKLIKVVEVASRENMELAALKERIEELGETAVKIAQKVPSLSALFLYGV